MFKLVFTKVCGYIFKSYYFFIYERENERDIYCFTIYAFIDMCPDWGLNPEPVTIGQCSNQLSNPGRTMWEKSNT